MSNPSTRRAPSRTSGASPIAPAAGQVIAAGAAGPHAAAALPTREAMCDTHGPYLSRCLAGRVWTHCPACVEGQLQRENERQEQAQREARLMDWQRRLGRAGIPLRFQDRSFDDFEAVTGAQRTALAFAREFALDFGSPARRGRGALFVGHPGTGKTHLACAIGMHLLHEGRLVLFTTVLRAVRMVKDAWGPAAQMTESQAVSRLTRPDLLILDEVGVQTGSEFERHLLSDVLNERYEHRRATLLLSNLPLADVGAYLGERVLDRLREDGAESVVFDWESHRGAAR